MEENTTTGEGPGSPPSAVCRVMSCALIPANRKEVVVSRNLLFHRGTSQERVLNAASALRQGRGVLIVDDADRENEGDLIFSAETLSTEQMAMLIRECSGIVCLCITCEKAVSLDLPQMVQDNTSSYGTAFTVSIEAAEGVTTGVSASDRVKTVKAAVSADAGPGDLRRPGHVFPLVAKDGGVFERPGHTEATVDMMKIAGLPPHGVLCELTNPDGSMASLRQMDTFALRHDMAALSVRDIIEYRNGMA